uniref:RNase H type-1 domain-containing protein n=1 Tax=Cannabis sativa TaxID=3483 RepID=A0A803PS00_CANSA
MWAAWAIGRVGEFPVVVAELLALQVGLLWASNSGFNVMRVETDSLIVYNWVNCPNSNIMLKSLIDEIIFLLAIVGGGFCFAILRVVNGVAHTLVKSVTSLIEVDVWTDACPMFRGGNSCSRVVFVSCRDPCITVWSLAWECSGSQGPVWLECWVRVWSPDAGSRSSAQVQVRLGVQYWVSPRVESGSESGADLDQGPGSQSREVPAWVLRVQDLGGPV